MRNTRNLLQPLPHLQGFGKYSGAHGHRPPEKFAITDCVHDSDARFMASVMGFLVEEAPKPAGREVRIINELPNLLWNPIYGALDDNTISNYPFNHAKALVPEPRERQPNIFFHKLSTIRVFLRGGPRLQIDCITAPERQVCSEQLFHILLRFQSGQERVVPFQTHLCRGLSNCFRHVFKQVFFRRV